MTTWESGYKAGYTAGLLHAANLPERSQRVIVGEFIKAWPRLRSSEIAKRTGIKHTSVRVALHRLLMEGAAQNKGGRWFSVATDKAA